MENAMTSTVAIADELLTEGQAAARIPGRRAEVVEWLRGLGITRRGPTGLRCYRWAEILARIPLENEPAAAPEPVQRGPWLRRSSAI